MRAQAASKALLPALAVSAALAGAASAASIEVVPTLLELPEAGGATQLRLINHAAEPADVQIESFAWTQDGEERFRYTRSRVRRSHT